MASIITNRSALQALQSVNAAGRDLATAQQRVSTSLKVSGARDDASIYAIAQGMRAETIGWQAAGQSLARVQSALNVASSAANTIHDLLAELRAKVTAYADRSLSASSIGLLRQDIERLVAQVSGRAALAEFDGLNFINGGGVTGTVLRTPRTTYSLPTSSLTPQSFNTVMSAGAVNSSVTATMQARHGFNLPYSTLTPDAFAGFAPSAVSSGTTVTTSDPVWSTPTTAVFTRSPYGGHPFPDAPVRVDFELDLLTQPKTVEVWQNGVRVAASGQPQALGGAAVGAAVAATGRQMISFDYIPANGEDVEIRVVGGGPGASYIDHGVGFGAVGTPRPAPTSTLSRSVLAQPAGGALPGEPLSLETAGAPATGGVPPPFMLNAGTNPGRVDLLFDASLTPDVVEIWQGGQRVAASGRPYAPGGGAVGAGVPTAGGQVISFDYDPAAGQTLEIRVNEANAHPGAAWVVGGIVLQSPGAPLPTIDTTPAVTQRITVGVVDDAEFTSAPPPLTPETYALSSASRTHVIDAGINAGRIDVAFEAYDDPDVLEVWQGGALLATTGPVSGASVLSFDYDPAGGQALEFRFNPGVPTPGAWTVGAIAFNEIGSPPVTTTVGGGPQTGVHSGTIFTKVSPVKSEGGDVLEVATRDLTAAGLGLDALDWLDPRAMLAAVDSAIRTATEAATYLGTQESLIEALLLQNSRLRDTLEAGVGKLVDADLGREAARLQAAQIRAQLAGQTLSIANAAPEWMLGLFRR